MVDDKGDMVKTKPPDMVTLGAVAAICHAHVVCLVRDRMRA